uniref:Transcriptional regulator n=1 Tax=uncultured Nitrospirae bacterium MY2-3C TaxID=798577 RepID=D9MP13_9BACT|nr:hypothetical protein LW2_0270 [uncultured Nitrospirae bacterium MY2-3C]
MEVIAMSSQIPEEPLTRTIDSVSGENILFEVLEYIPTIKVMGAKRLKQVKVTMKNREILMESGALHFMKGDILIEIPTGSAGGIFKRAVASVVTNEAVVKPLYKGSGEIYLEPSYSDYILINIDNTQLIADKGLFYCCESSLQVGAASQKNLMTGLAGGEGFFQTLIKGTGICVLQSPVPLREIMQVQLDNDTLKVDGTFALLRIGDIDFTVERSTRTLLGSAASGEGLLQVFRGTGQVWLAPTLGVR